MPMAGDDHLRRQHVDAAKAIIKSLPGSPKPKARDRDELIAKALRIKPSRYAKGIRLDAERELQAEQAGESGSGIRYLDDLADLVERAEGLFRSAIELGQLNAASSALKQLHALRQDQSTWRGERPPDPDSDKRTLHAVFRFGGPNG